MHNNWTAITESWRAPNGMVVTPVSTNERLRQIGETLGNGLREDWARNKWAGLCVAGRRQILEISDISGALVATAMLRANKTDGPMGGAQSQRAHIETLFVRGGGNTVFAEGHPAFEAVSLFVRALNDPADVGLSFIGRVSETGFSSSQGDHSQAVDREAEAHRGPDAPSFRSLDDMLRDIGLKLRDPPPGALGEFSEPALTENSWTPLTPPYRSSEGWLVEPIGDAKGMRLLGEEIENLMFNDGILAPIIETCARGLARYAAIKDPKGVIRGYAQFGFSGGFPNFIVARGYCDQRLPAPAVEAINEYCRGIRKETIPLTVSIGPGGFMAPSVAADQGVQDLGRVMGEMPEAIALPIPPVQASDPREEAIRVATEDSRGISNETWEVPAPPWEDPSSGWHVRVAERTSDILDLAPHFPGNLGARAALEHFARAAKAGQNFIVSVHDKDSPQAYGVLTLNDEGVAQLTYLYGRGRNETEALCNRPKEAIAAAEQWLHAYNSGALAPRNFRIS